MIGTNVIAHLFGRISLKVINMWISLCLSGFDKHSGICRLIMEI